MWPLTTAAANALTDSGRVDVRVTAYTSAYGEVSGIPVASGSITVDATSQVRRTGTLGIADDAYWPADPFAILSPLGSELGVEYGIGIPDGTTVFVPVFRGPVTDVQRTRPYTSGGAALSVSVADRSSKVAEARFNQPTQTLAGATAVAEIRRLITDVLPAVTVTDLTGSTQVAAQLDIQRERWSDGIEKLADSISGEVFSDPLGNFVIRPTPTLNDPSVWVVSTGDGGALLNMDEQRTRERTYNRVVASGERTDGSPPVYAVVSDTNPASETYIGGQFGIKPRFYASPLLTTTLQCTSAATSLLARTTGMQGTVTLTTLVNPALDCGDVIVVRDNDRVSAHIIDTLTIPLSPKDSQQITTRSLELPAES